MDRIINKLFGWGEKDKKTEILRLNKDRIIKGTMLVVGLVIILIWTPGRKSGEDKKTTTVKPRPMAPFEMDSPTEIRWTIGEVKLPEKTEEYKLENEGLIEERIFNLLAAVGMEGTEKTESSKDMWFYNSKDGGKTAYIDMANKKFGYSKNIVNKKQITEGKIRAVESIKNDFYRLTEEMNGKGLRVGVETTGYKKMVYPRWVTAEEKEAEAVEFGANYYLSEGVVKLFTGEAIKGEYSMSGELLKLEMAVMPKVTTTGKKSPLKTMEELKKVNIGQIKVWKIEGGKEYELSEGDQIIRKMNVTSVKFGYVYDQKETLWPYYFLEGNAFPGIGPVKVTAVVDAVK